VPLRDRQFLASANVLPINANSRVISALTPEDGNLAVLQMRQLGHSCCIGFAWEMRLKRICMSVA